MDTENWWKCCYVVRIQIIIQGIESILQKTAIKFKCYFINKKSGEQSAQLALMAEIILSNVTGIQQ